MEVSGKILAKQDLDSLLDEGPDDDESTEDFLERCMDALYDMIYRSPPPTSTKGAVLHGNSDPERDLEDLNKGGRKIAWIPATSIINLAGVEIQNTQDARSYTLQELNDRGFRVVDISRGDFNLPTSYNRWIAYASVQSEWRARFLGFYVQKMGDAIQADPNGVNLAEYHIALGLLLGFSHASIFRYLKENGYSWPESSSYDAYRCLVRSRISELDYMDKIALDAEFSGWLREYEMFWYPTGTLFQVLENQKRGRSEIASVYLMGHDVTAEDVFGLDEFPEAVDPGIFTLEVGFSGRRYNLEQMLRRADRISKDVRGEGHDCYIDSVKEGKNLRSIEAADELSQRLARLKRKKADDLEYISYGEGNEKVARRLVSGADILRSQATYLETDRAYDYERVGPFEHQKVEHTAAAHIAEAPTREHGHVLASAAFFTRIKKGLGAKLSDKEQAELTEVEKEKYLLSREKKKVATDLDVAIARLERRAINQRSDIAKYNRVIETALDRKLRGLDNKDVLGSERMEEHEDTIEKTNVLRVTAENELHATERELEKLKKQKTGKARNATRPLTASCPKKIMVREIEGSQEEANRMYVALTTDVSMEANVYLLYLRTYHELFMQISESYAPKVSANKLSSQEAREAVLLGQKIHAYWGSPTIYLNSLSLKERNDTISALRNIDGAYNSIKRASER